jgi:hypothetical protein
VRLHSVGYHLQRRVHISRVGTSEKLREIVMENFLYVFILMMFVPLIIKNEIDVVLSMPLTGFEVKKL